MKRKGRQRKPEERKEKGGVGVWVDGHEEEEC